MKLRRESAGNGDFWARRANSKSIFRAESYRDTFRSENRFLNRKSTVIGDRSSRLHEISGLAQALLDWCEPKAILMAGVFCRDSTGLT
jgi:hypothetical protein